MGCKESNQTNKQTNDHPNLAVTKQKEESISIQRVDYKICTRLFQQFWEEAPGQNWEKMIN